MRRRIDCKDGHSFVLNDEPWGISFSIETSDDVPRVEFRGAGHSLIALVPLAELKRIVSLDEYAVTEETRPPETQETVQ